MDLETLIASNCRRRILRVLSRTKRTNVMELVRKVNSTYNQVSLNLHILQKEGIVFDEHFGRMRVIGLNRENSRTIILLEALRMLENSERRNRKNLPPQFDKSSSPSDRKLLNKKN